MTHPRKKDPSVAALEPTKRLGALSDLIGKSIEIG
jgi:hypothetical protein